MVFKILNRFQRPAYNAKSRAYLTWDNWNDYSYYTLFGLIYVDENSGIHDIGSVKIGYQGQKIGQDGRNLSIGDEFDGLDPIYFSLGQSDTYYERLDSLGADIRDEILLGLRDIARVPEIYDLAIKEDVTKVSLFRTVSQTSVVGQFRRLAVGGERQQPYSFEFRIPKAKSGAHSISLLFEVKPFSFPPTNIHIIIGRNGVGKTYLLNAMISSLIDEEKSRKGGEFRSKDKGAEAGLFANLVSISFSAFDESEPQAERKDKTQGIQYSYIGLKRIQSANSKSSEPKSTVMLKNEFFLSLDSCKRNRKTDRWKRAIEMLESDPMFQEADIRSLIDEHNDDEFKKRSHETFRRLSSGHKIVLLIITRLIETLQERTLVLIDEPESHLHPPLLATFTRALSELLTSTNGVAIIATHSPVILQEAPASCIYKLRRAGIHTAADRLNIESFGENVGILTNEVFGLEITKSGFYNLLTESVEGKSYDEVVRHFNDQLGMEARAIIMSMLANQ